MNTDETKSLAQLTGVDWGPAPSGASSLIQDRHEFRRTPLERLSIPALRRLLSLDFGDDREFLIPYALEKIADPLPQDTEELSQCCNLLLGALLNERYGWLHRPELVYRIRRLVESACYTLYRVSGEAEETSEHLEYYRVLISTTQMQASLYEALAHFEQRLSKVEQAGCTKTSDGGLVTNGALEPPGR